MPKIEHLYGAVLDTHAWIWLSAGDPRGQSLRAFQGQAIISAISVWEVAMLESKGRLSLKPDVESWIQSNLSLPVVLEPISPTIAVESCRLPDFHGDPADRLIVATAYTLGLPLITADEKILTWNRSHPIIQLIAL